jgi:hypothetical protein
VDLHLYGRIQVYSPCFWWEQEKACVPERKLAPDCWDGKSLELSYDNLEEERLRFELKKYLEDRLAIIFSIS